MDQWRISSTSGLHGLTSQICRTLNCVSQQYLEDGGAVVHGAALIPDGRIAELLVLHCRRQRAQLILLHTSATILQVFKLGTSGQLRAPSLCSLVAIISSS